MAEQVKVSVDDELEPDDIEITSEPDESKFIPARPEDEEAAKEEEEAEKKQIALLDEAEKVLMEAATMAKQKEMTKTNSLLRSYVNCYPPHSQGDFHTDDGTLIVDLKTTSDASELGFQNIKYEIEQTCRLSQEKLMEQKILCTI